MKGIDYILITLIWLVVLFIMGCAYYTVFIIRY